MYCTPYTALRGTEYFRATPGPRRPTAISSAPQPSCHSAVRAWEDTGVYRVHTSSCTDTHTSSYRHTPSSLLPPPPSPSPSRPPTTHLGLPQQATPPAPQHAEVPRSTMRRSVAAAHTHVHARPRLIPTPPLHPLPSTRQPCPRRPGNLRTPQGRETAQSLLVFCLYSVCLRARSLPTREAEAASGRASCVRGRSRGFSRSGAMRCGAVRCGPLFGLWRGGGMWQGGCVAADGGAARRMPRGIRGRRGRWSR